MTNKVFDMIDSKLIQVEKLEKKYLDKFYHFLMFAKEDLFEGFDTANAIRNDWSEGWKAKGSFDKGAERIVYSFFNTQGFGAHNSTPVASDLFFQTEDAFIHIDLKTISSTNYGDASGKYDIEQNQSSYPGPKFKPNLPPYYTVGGKTKPCLTYFIVIIYEKDDFSVPCMYISCMPNGSLRTIYGDRIISRGKAKGKNARYTWKDSQYFELLNNFEEQPKRIRMIHYDDRDNETNIRCEICDDKGRVLGRKKKKGALVTCKRCDGTKIKTAHYLKNNLAFLKEIYDLDGLSEQNI